MGRPRKYNIEEVLAKIREYRLEHPNEMLKSRTISDYLKKNGFPIEPYTIKRTPEFREELEKLNRGTAAEVLATIAIYKKIDIDRFFRENRTQESLREAIVSLDAYYGALAASASAVISEKDKFLEENKSLHRNIEDLKSQIKDADQLKEEIRHLKKEVSSLKTILNEYVYPEVANAILSEAGTVENSFVNPEKATDMIVDESTEFDIDILNDISKGIKDEKIS